MSPWGEKYAKWGEICNVPRREKKYIGKGGVRWTWDVVCICPRVRYSFCRNSRSQCNHPPTFLSLCLPLSHLVKSLCKQAADENTREVGGSTGEKEGARRLESCFCVHEIGRWPLLAAWIQQGLSQPGWEMLSALASKLLAKPQEDRLAFPCPTRELVNE